MAKYIECDICGRKMTTTIENNLMRLCRVHFEYGYELDLCPTCSRDLQEWVHTKQSERLKDILGLTAVTKG